MKAYPHIFSPIKLGTKVAKNRIYMAPMGTNQANSDGSAGEQIISYYVRRAKGGTGIIVPGVVCVDYPQGKTVAQQLRLDQLKYINGYSRMAQEVHRYGALLILQLHHAGMSTDILTTEGIEPVALSPDIDEHQKQLVGTKPKDEYAKSEKHILTIEDIHNLEQKYITAAKYAKMAGADGIMLHGGAHYLIGNFIQPGTNHRTDEYGGSLENRTRFAINIIKGIREVCGRDFAVGIRIALYKHDDESNKYIAQAVEAAGADFIDATFPVEVERQTELTETSDYEQGDRAYIAAGIKKYVNIPVFTNGGYKDPDHVEKDIAEGKADIVGLGRPLICDPDWCNKARKGKANEIRLCLSCMECASNNQLSRGLHCALNPEAGREYSAKIEPAAKEKKRVVIVGGGIAGMQAAITAAERGHEVCLFEKSDRLGGQMHLATVPPHKELIGKNIDWFVDELERKGVSVKLNTEVTADMIKEMNPDHVILATGSRPFIAPIKGVENTVESWDILSGKVKLPENGIVTIIGGGIVGIETAECADALGNKITIIERLPEMANGLFWMIRAEKLEEFANKGIEMYTNAAVKEISDANTVIYDLDGTEYTAKSDIIILSTGQKSVVTPLQDFLEDEGIDYTVIGDGKRPGKFVNATEDGYYAAVNLA